MAQEENNGINISIGSGQQLREGSSINISNIGNTTIGTGELRPDTAAMPRQEKESAMPPASQDSFDEAGPLREEIALKKRRLQARRLQAARSGSSTDPEITMEIEDLEKEIPTLERRLAQLERRLAQSESATPNQA